MISICNSSCSQGQHPGGQKATSSSHMLIYIPATCILCHATSLPCGLFPNKRVDFLPIILCSPDAMDIMGCPWSCQVGVVLAPPPHESTDSCQLCSLKCPTCLALHLAHSRLSMVLAEQRKEQLNEFPRMHCVSCALWHCVRVPSY